MVLLPSATCLRFELVYGKLKKNRVVFGRNWVLNGKVIEITLRHYNLHILRWAILKHCSQTYKHKCPLKQICRGKKIAFWRKKSHIPWRYMVIYQLLCEYCNFLVYETTQNHSRYIKFVARAICKYCQCHMKWMDHKLYLRACGLTSIWNATCPNFMLIIVLVFRHNLALFYIIFELVLNTHIPRDFAQGSAGVRNPGHPHISGHQLFHHHEHKFSS